MSAESRRTWFEGRIPAFRLQFCRLVTEDVPPFLIIHGDADKVVPLQQSERLLAELQAKHVAAELIVKPGGGHPWLTIPVEVKKLADWFDQRLKNMKVD